MLHRITHYAIALLLSVGLNYQAFAADVPTLSGEFVLESQFEKEVHDSRNNERDRLFARAELASALQLNEHFYIDSVTVLEPVFDATIGENRFFDDEGVFIEEIKLNYENGPWGAFIGKFNPAFGIAWDYGRGIWSEDFAEDYEITEKIGLGGAYQFELADMGAHRFTFSTFFTDTSFLSRSIVQDRSTLKRQDGGASNTENFSSYVVSLDGKQVADIKNLSYHLAFRHLGRGVGDVDDEQGVAANLNYLIPVSDEWESDLLLELASISHFNGTADDARFYSVSNVNTLYEDWNVTVGYTKRFIDVASGRDNHDYLLQLSGGYDFRNGITLEAGWRKSREANVTKDIIGGLARYTRAF